MVNCNCTIPPATAEALRSQLAAEGFHPGRPAHLPAEVLALDLRIYSRQRCRGCNRRLRVEAWTDGRGYRLLCACPACEFAEVC
jgi:hypothetical protein